VDGYQYSVESQATDNANNLEVNYTTITFIVDSSTPTAMIQVPANHQFITRYPRSPAPPRITNPPSLEVIVVSRVNIVELQIHDDTGDTAATNNPLVDWVRLDQFRFPR